MKLPWSKPIIGNTRTSWTRKTARFWSIAKNRHGCRPSAFRSRMRPEKSASHDSEDCSRNGSRTPTVKGIIADANAIGEIEALVQQMQTGVWAEFWTGLGLEFKRFADVSLSQDASDLVIWQTCQAEQLVLLTDNRSQKSPD